MKIASPYVIVKASLISFVLQGCTIKKRGIHFKVNGATFRDLSKAAGASAIGTFRRSQATLQVRWSMPMTNPPEPIMLARQ
jgi:hypothetical protein